MRLFKSFFIALICCFGALLYFECANAGSHSCDNYEFYNDGCTDCMPGCYCKHNGTVLDIDWPFSGISDGEVEAWCASGTKCPDAGKTDGENTYGDCGRSGSAGIYKCPSDFSKSAAKATSIEDCFQQCKDFSPLYYKSIKCNPGQYVRVRDRSCTDCPVGNYCKGGTFTPSCDDHQGITGTCKSENKYSEGGKSVCSTCGAGNYVNSGHTACNPCGKGYSCSDGSENRQKCEGLYYSNTNTATSCSSCANDGYAVVKENGLNVGCTLCDEGKYANNHTECKECEAGYECKSGISKQCTGNTYAGEGQSSCSTCDTKTHLITTKKNPDGTTVQIGCTACRSSTPYAFNGSCDSCKGADKYVNKDGQCQSCPAIPSGAGAGYYKADASVVTSGEENCRYGKTSTGCTNKYKYNNYDYAVIYKYNPATSQYELDSENPVSAKVNNYVKEDKASCATCKDFDSNKTYSNGGEIDSSKCYSCEPGSCISGQACHKCSAGFACPADKSGKVQKCKFFKDGYFGVVGCGLIGNKYSSYSEEGAIACSSCGSGTMLNIYDEDNNTNGLFKEKCSGNTTNNTSSCYYNVDGKTYYAVLGEGVQACVSKPKKICFINGTTEECLLWPDNFISTN